MTSPQAALGAARISGREGRRTRRARGRLAASVAAAAAICAWPLAALAAGTPAASGTFTGLAFDTCGAPSTATMDAWMSDKTDPYRGIGIYISGELRGCSQPNLTASWVAHVRQGGWKVLPLTVGPQASCTGFSKVISDAPAKTYAAARQQGAAQADDAVAHARSLGIQAGTTLFYDMENWHTGYDACDASTLWFMSAWSNRLHSYGYAGGVYVSGGSGGRLLNDMANTPPSGYVLPDQIWLAEWNNQENNASSYVDPTNWAGHNRAHQYFGGHRASNGGVTLNVDSNYVDLGPVVIPAVVPDSAIGAKPAQPPLAVVPPSAPASPSVGSTPTATATPSKAPTATATATPTRTPTATAMPVAPKPTVTTKPTPVPKQTAAPKPTVAAKPTAVPTPTVAAKPVVTPKPVVPARPVASAKPTAVATSKPRPGHHAAPKATPAPQRAVVPVDPGTSVGIQPPVRPAAKPLPRKAALKVPSMGSPSTARHGAPSGTSVAGSAVPKAVVTHALPTDAAISTAEMIPANAPEQPLSPLALLANTQALMTAAGHALVKGAVWLGHHIVSLLPF